jgi:hypothetical protein
MLVVTGPAVPVVLVEVAQVANPVPAQQVQQTLVVVAARLAVQPIHSLLLVTVVPVS